MKVRVLIESTKVNIFSTYHILRSTYFQNLRYQGQLREAECGYEEEQRQRQEVVAKNLVRFPDPLADGSGSGERRG